MNQQLATVLVLLFGVLLGAAGFHLVVTLGLRAIGMPAVLRFLAKRHPQDYVDACPECIAAGDDGCTCSELVIGCDDDGNPTQGHQPGCPLVEPAKTCFSWCPATRQECDQPCIGSNCFRLDRRFCTCDPSASYGTNWHAPDCPMQDLYRRPPP